MAAALVGPEATGSGGKKKDAIFYCSQLDKVSNCLPGKTRDTVPCVFLLYQFRNPVIIDPVHMNLLKWSRAYANPLL